MLQLWNVLEKLYRQACYAVWGRTISSIAADYGITHSHMLGMSIFLNVVLAIVLILLLARRKRVNE